MIVRRAELRDLEALVPLHAAAFAGQMGPVIGPGYLRAFLRWFMVTPGSVFLVADQEGQLAGYVFGFSDGYSPGLTRHLLPHIALGVLAHLPSVVKHPSFRWQLRSRLTNLMFRREPRRQIFATTPPDCFNLVGIGTSPAVRGQGVGRQLIEHFCAQVPDRTVLLDVFRDNSTALALYRRCGFGMIAEEGRVVRMIRRPSESARLNASPSAGPSVQPRS